MFKALIREQKKALVPAVASALLPGLGQLINGDVNKALAVFAIAAITGAGFIGVIPILGPLAGWLYGAVWLYAVGDAFVRGKRR